MLCPRAREAHCKAPRLASAVPSWAYPVTGNKVVGNAVSFVGAKIDAGKERRTMGKPLLN